MKNKEAIITRMYSTKNGELVVSVKLKYGEVSPQEELQMRDWWREGEPCDITLDQFQPEFVDPAANE